MLRLKSFLHDLKTPALAVAFLAYTLVVLMHKMLLILFGKKVLQVGESDVVDILSSFDHAFLAVAATAGLLFVLTGLKTVSRLQRVFWGFSIASGIAALLWPEALYVSVCCFIACLMSEKTLQVQCEDNFPIRLPLNFLVNLFLMFSIALFLCASLEIFFTIAQYSGKLFPQSSFRHFLGLSYSLSLCFSLISTLLVGLVLQALLLILWLGQKFCKLSKNTAIFSFLLFHALALAILAYILVRIMFNESIQALNFEFYAPLLILLPMTLLFALSWVSLCRMSKHTKISTSDLGSFYNEMFLASGFCIFIPFIGAKGRKLHLPLTVLAYSLACAGLIYLNYPVIADFTDRFGLVLSFMVIVTVSVIFFLLCRNLHITLPKRLTWAIIAVLLLTMPLGIHLYKYQDVRMIVLEYSKLSFPQLTLVKRFIPQMKPVGFGKDTTMRYHPKVYDTFTEPKIKGHPPIFIFLLDALRPDHTNLYPYPREITPNIEKLGKEGVFFKNAYSATTATSCSLRHMFTGRYSSRYMLEKKKIDPFWIEDLIDAGYGTFVLNDFGSDYNGISMEAFHRNIPQQKLDKADFISLKTYDEFPKVDDALKILAKIQDKFAKNPESRNGLFCYLHGCRPHPPWSPTKQIYGPEPINRYDAAIKEADQAVGIFLEGIKKLGLYDNAIIIIIADHGAGLMEHGRYGSFLTYEENIRIPLLFRVPGNVPHVCETPVQNIDIGPTLLDLVSDETHNRFHGISLAGEIRGKPLPIPRQYLFALSAFEDLACVIDKNHYKFHYHRRYGYYQLYDLKNDPKETRNLADSKPEMAKKYLQVMDRFLRAGNQTYNNPYHYSTFDPTKY